MSNNWSIETIWDELSTGAPEERATFGMLGIRAHGTWLTTGHERLQDRVSHAPHLSSYYLAEWFAWNWWRLRWEPRKASAEWEMSHAVGSIGNGYVWPDLRIISDGKKMTLVCRPTPEQAPTPYRYINDSVSVITGDEFESELDRFIGSTLDRLDSRQITASNLHDVWHAVLQERADPVQSRLRKLEALLGEEPDEVDAGKLQEMLDQAQVTGQGALEEIAADRKAGDNIPDVPSLLALGRAHGTRASTRDRVALRAPQDVGMDVAQPSHDADAAWKTGTAAARWLRKQEHIEPDTQITNSGLADMYGAPPSMLGAQQALPLHMSSRLGLSFALQESNSTQRILLRSKWESGRRFEMARLLGDVLTCETDDAMRPVTRSDTYRQKVQRAFAAELLSPFNAVDEMLNGDYSMENQQDVAHHFQVSDMTIRTLLVNHGRLERGELGETGWTVPD